MVNKITRIINHVTAALGSIPAILIVITAIILWAVSGPLFNYSDAWQLSINTTTTVITSVMVFIIQNSQNRDGRAIQVKLDAVLSALDKAPNALVGIEENPEKEIKRHQDEVRANAEE